MMSRPWMTNAAHNRLQACRMFEAGMTAAEISAEFPQAYRCKDDRLRLIYSTEATWSLHRSDPDAREFGLKEMSLMVSSQHVDKVIKKHKARSPA